MKQFNERLRSGGIHFQFPESPVPHWLPPVEGRRIFQEMFVAVDDVGFVHGGYILKHQEFILNGERVTIGNYQLPLSEGVIDNTFNSVGLLLLQDALKRNPMLYALGMGGVNRPLPKILVALDWRLALVPFAFKVCRSARFLRNITYLRNSPTKRLLCDLAAFTGVGYLAINMMQALHASGPTAPTIDKIVTTFGDDCDRLGQSCQDTYSLAAVRDSATLNILYPESDDRFIHLLVHDRSHSDSAPLGWAVMLDTSMKDHKQFGNMQVGTIVDCLAVPGHEKSVIASATLHLNNRGVDIIVSNQSHPAWVNALRSYGYLSGPSNFALATSPALTSRLTESDPSFDRLHFNRGDGDGPIHL